MTDDVADSDKSKARKVSYVGAPAIFLLELECAHINDAFGSFGCYHVGSSRERPDWRDVDIRFIMEDAEFMKLFPDVSSLDNGSWEHDPRWLLLTTAISAQLKAKTGLPVDFQFQPQSFANAHHKKPRNAIGFRIAKRSGDSA